MSDDDIKELRSWAAADRLAGLGELARLIDALLAERERLTDVLYSNGFVRCDISACNCGSWHARYGLRERFEELKDALSEATDLNGKTVLSALNEVIAERDALRSDAERYRWLCSNNFDRQGTTQIHTWLHTWEPHSQTGEPTEWMARLRGGALDAAIDAARKEQA